MTCYMHSLSACTQTLIYHLIHMHLHTYLFISRFATENTRLIDGFEVKRLLILGIDYRKERKEF